MRKFQVTDLGLIDYEKCLALQKSLLERRLAGEVPDTLLLLEHEPVITMGTSGGELVAPREMVERAGVKVYTTDRGGNVTYHGPGQLVGYPIFDLREHGKDIHLLLRHLEQVVIDCMADYGTRGERIDGLTGVWVGGDKICSIGVAVRRWISYHGFAFNIDPNYEHWGLINPCGLVGRTVTSMAELLGKAPDMQQVKRSIAEKAAAVFGMEQA
ncbi:MAG: lipoyl(octanoyl) transferase LipB [Armatimonadota bacterium]